MYHLPSQKYSVIIFLFCLFSDLLTEKNEIENKANSEKVRI